MKVQLTIETEIRDGGEFSWIQCPFCEQEELEDRTHKYWCYLKGICKGHFKENCPIVKVDYLKDKSTAK